MSNEPKEPPSADQSNGPPFHPHPHGPYWGVPPQHMWGPPHMIGHPAPYGYPHPGMRNWNPWAPYWYQYNPGGYPPASVNHVQPVAPPPPPPPSEANIPVMAVPPAPRPPPRTPPLEDPQDPGTPNDNSDATESLARENVDGHHPDPEVLLQQYMQMGESLKKFLGTNKGPTLQEPKLNEDSTTITSVAEPQVQAGPPAEKKGEPARNRADIEKPSDVEFITLSEEEDEIEIINVFNNVHDISFPSEESGKTLEEPIGDIAPSTSSSTGCATMETAPEESSNGSSDTDIASSTCSSTDNPATETPSDPSPNGVNDTDITSSASSSTDSSTPTTEESAKESSDSDICHTSSSSDNAAMETPTDPRPNGDKDIDITISTSDRTAMKTPEKRVPGDNDTGSSSPQVIIRRKKRKLRTRIRESTSESDEFPWTKRTYEEINTESIEYSMPSTSSSVSSSHSHEWYDDVQHSKWNRRPSYMLKKKALKDVINELGNTYNLRENVLGKTWDLDSFIEFLNELDLGGCHTEPASSTEPSITPCGSILFDREKTVPWASCFNRCSPTPHVYEEYASRMRMRSARYLETGADPLGLAGCSSEEWTSEIYLEAPDEMRITFNERQFLIYIYVEKYAADGRIYFSVSVSGPRDEKIHWAESIQLTAYCNGEQTELHATLHSSRLKASQEPKHGFPLRYLRKPVRLVLTVSPIQFSLPCSTNKELMRIPKYSDPLKVLYYHSSFLYFTCNSLAEFLEHFGDDVVRLGQVLEITGTRISDENVSVLLAFSDALRIETLFLACEQHLLKSEMEWRKKKTLADGFMLTQLMTLLPLYKDTHPVKGKVPPLKICRKNGVDGHNWRLVKRVASNH